MNYHVVPGIYGFYSEFHSALTASGFFDDTNPHKLVIPGNLFGRRHEANELQDFVLMEKDEVILALED